LPTADVRVPARAFAAVEVSVRNAAEAADFQPQHLMQPLTSGAPLFLKGDPTDFVVLLPLAGIGCPHVKQQPSRYYERGLLREQQSSWSKEKRIDENLRMKELTFWRIRLFQI